MVIIFYNLSLILISISLSFSYPPCDSVLLVYRGDTLSFLGGFVHKISHATPVCFEKRGKT